MKLDSMLKTMRRGTKRLKKAEKRGDLETLRKRLALAMQLVEVAMLAAAVSKGLKVGRNARVVKRRKKK
jgi:hypothetical protein